jgi:hypothetical protein
MPFRDCATNERKYLPINRLKKKKKILNKRNPATEREMEVLNVFCFCSNDISVHFQLRHYSADLQTSTRMGLCICGSYLLFFFALRLRVTSIYLYFTDCNLFQQIRYNEILFLLDFFSSYCIICTVLGDTIQSCHSTHYYDTICGETGKINPLVIIKTFIMTFSRQLLYLSIVAYGPSLALSQGSVTN